MMPCCPGSAACRKEENGMNPRRVRALKVRHTAIGSSLADVRGRPFVYQMHVVLLKGPTFQIEDSLAADSARLS